MSIAKKSVQWLVVAFVVLAIALAASFVTHSITRAIAEEDTEMPLMVIVEATDGEVDSTYPDLASGTARTISAKYYFEMPDVASSAPVLAFSPILELPSGSMMRPTAITLNSAFSSILTLENITEYISGAANAFTAELEPGYTTDDLSGVSMGLGGVYTLEDEKYLFTATYALASDAENGTYDFGLGAFVEFSLNSSSVIYTPFVAKHVDATHNGVLVNDETKGWFNIRSVNTLTFDIPQNGVVKAYDGVEVSVGDVDEDIVYTTNGNGSVTIKFYEDVSGVRDEEINAPAMAGTYWVGVSVAEDEQYVALEEQFAQFIIEPSEVNVKFSYVYNNETYWFDYVNDAFVKVESEPTASTFVVGDAIPEPLAIRWFKNDGFKFNGIGVHNFTVEMDGATLSTTYSFAVGMGDADGDGFITARDVLQMKRYFVGLDSGNVIPNEAMAWASLDDDEYLSPVFLSALDVNGSGRFRTNDIVAVREALATGYSYKIVVEDGVQQVKKRSLVQNYADFVSAVTSGYPITLAADITAATEDFSVDLTVPADIDLGGYTLTVNSFSLSNVQAGATLAIRNGTIVTVDGISVTAPNGNVIVADVNGYSYEGTTVVLSAYNSSLHFEGTVAFMTYTVENKTVSEVKEDLAEITNNTDTTEAKALAVLAKLSDSAPAELEIPVDTHVVVERGANLSVDQITVVEASNAGSNVTTFSVEVKNETADTIKVNVTTKENEAYVVETVNLAGEISKIEIVKDASQEVSTQNATIEEFLDAIAAKESYIEVKYDVSLDDTVLVDYPLEIKIFDDKTITAATGKTAFNVNGGSLLLSGSGNVVGETDSTLIRVYGDTDPTSTNYSIFTLNEGVSVINPAGYGVMITRNDTSAYGAVLYVDGTVVGGYGALYINGSVARHEGDVVNGAPIDSVAKIYVGDTAILTGVGTQEYETVTAIYGAGFAVWTVERGASLSGASGIYIKSGFLTVENGVDILANAGSLLPYVFNNDGCDATGDGIIVDNCFYPGENAVVVLGDELEDTITVMASGARKIAVYWAVGSAAELEEAVAANAEHIFLKSGFDPATPDGYILETSGNIRILRPNTDA